MNGESVHLVLFDLGAEVDLERVRLLLDQVPRPAPVAFRPPVMAFSALPVPIEVDIPGNSLSGFPEGAWGTARLYAIGVLAIRLRIPFSTPSLDLLGEVAPASVSALASDLVEACRCVLHPAFIRPYDVEVPPEGYLVHCFHDGPDLLADPPQAARLLAGDPATALSEDAQETLLRHRVQYARDDLFVAGWDAALIQGPPGTYEDTLAVIEMANVELLEYRTFDAYLDRQLDRSFEATRRLWGRGGVFRSARRLLADTAEVSGEIARLSDNLHDTGKPFGDWYLAKVHQRLRDRFHLADWDHAVSAKRETLERTYRMAHDEANYRRGLWLEVAIVGLILVEGLFFVWEAFRA